MASYYDILGLESNDVFTAEELKRAYKRALLRHHPDKASGLPNRAHGGRLNGIVSVDEISVAYKTLSDTRLRQEYDRGLHSKSHKPQQYGQNADVHRPGMETVDLDSLVFDDASETWSRSCRCGDDRGLIVTEAELEANAKDGEIIAGCKGCSLWLRVLFSVEE